MFLSNHFMSSMNNKNSEWSNTQCLELLLHGDNRTEFQGLWKTLHQSKISECSIVKIQIQIRHAVNRLCLWQCLLWQIMWLYCSLFGVHNTCTYFKPVDTGKLWLQPHRWWSTVSALSSMEYTLFSALIKTWQLNWRTTNSAYFTVFILQNVNIQLVPFWGCFVFECLILKIAVWLTDLSYSLHKKIIKWIWACVLNKPSNSLWKCPIHTSAVLSYFFEKNSIVNMDSYKIQISINSDFIDKALYPSVLNIKPLFICQFWIHWRGSVPFCTKY